MPTLNTKLTGLMPALVTAYTPDNKRLDCDAIARQCERLCKAGMHGLYVGGSTGEMVLLTIEERKQLLETVVSAVGGKMTVIAHVGGLSTQHTIELAEHAEKVGADAFSAVSPIYFKYSYAEIREYYRAIASAVSIPAVIYNIPAYTGFTYTIPQMCELLALDNVAGMKFSCSDFYALERVRTKCPDKVVFNGSDEMLLSGLVAGATGGIGSTYNVMPEKILKVFNLFNEGKLDEARAAQREVNAIIEIMLACGVVPSIKYLLARMGIEYGVCREPFAPLTPESRKLLDSIEL